MCPLSIMKSPDVSLIFFQKERDSLIFPDLKIYCEILWFSLTLANLHSAHYLYKKKLIDQVKGKLYFQKVRPKGKQCAMTGALFSEKCARGIFSAPFAQWRSPNASLYLRNYCWVCALLIHLGWSHASHICDSVTAYLQTAGWVNVYDSYHHWNIQSSYSVS